MNDLRTAMIAAIKTSRIPFNVYEGDEHEVGKELITHKYLDTGNFFILAESNESEYGVLIVPTPSTTIESSILGDKVVPCTVYELFYPLFEQGDWSVGLEDSFLLEYEAGEADYVANTIADAATTSVLHMLELEIKMNISNALEAKYFRDNQFIS